MRQSILARLEEPTEERGAEVRRRGAELVGAQSLLYTTARIAIAIKITTAQHNTDRPVMTAADWPIGNRSSVLVDGAGFPRRSSTR